jgi:hypothetical protein
MTERNDWEVSLTQYKGFEWKAGMSIRHVSRTMRVCRVEEDEWLGERMFILYCFYDDRQPLAEVIVKDETLLNLDDEVTSAYCQMAVSSGLWTAP